MNEDIFIRRAIEMSILFRLSLLVVLMNTYGISAQDSGRNLNSIYPFNSFKSVIDTCMRSYSDALILHDRIANHERIDDLLDLLVGRLMRLESYIEQLIYAYRYEATVSFDELEYLMHMLDYLEITISETNYNKVGQGLNSIMERLKHELKDALGLLSLHNFSQVPLHHYWCLPSVNHLHQFA